MEQNELLLRTAFCCMACDGEIADEEIRLVKEYVKKTSLFATLNVEKLLNEYILSINSIGISFLNAFLKELREAEMTEEQEIQIMKIAIEMIEADKEIQYSEIRFFKRIISCLHVSDEIIERDFPDKEDYFLPDIVQQDYEFELESSFGYINLLDTKEANE